MKKALLIAMLVAAPVVASGLDEWRPMDTKLQLAFTTIGMVDIALTSYLIYDGSMGSNAAERNPILGKNPSQAKLWGWGLTGVVSHAVVARLLPNDLRTLWQTMGISIEIAVCGGNSTIIIGGKL